MEGASGERFFGREGGRVLGGGGGGVGRWRHHKTQHPEATINWIGIDDSNQQNSWKYYRTNIS